MDTTICVYVGKTIFVSVCQTVRPWECSRTDGQADRRTDWQTDGRTGPKTLPRPLTREVKRARRGRACQRSGVFIIPTYGVPALLTHMVASIDAIGAPSFNDNVWATSHWIPLRAFKMKSKSHFFLNQNGIVISVHLKFFRVQAWRRKTESVLILQTLCM